MAVGLVAVGCNSGGDTFVLGSTELNNSDAFSASSVASNNLAPDGGGLSPDQTNVSAFRVIWNCDLPDSDGPSSADSSALVLFTTQDARTFASLFSSNQLHPPVELLANDHDPSNAFNINAAVAVPLQTASYENAQATADTVNAVRGNSGIWLLVMSGRTSFADARLNQDDTLKGLRGVHQTIWSWLIDPSKAGTPSTIVDGVTVKIGTTTAVARNGEYRYGIQVNAGDEIPASFGANAARAGSGSGGHGNAPASPSHSAENVQNFGLISDGISGQATYLGFGGNPLSGTTARATGGNGPFQSFYEAGENTNVVHLYYTQLVTSLSAFGSTNFIVTTSGGQHGGSRIAGFESGFNLATLTFNAVKEVIPTGAATQLATQTATGNAGVQLVGGSPLGGFITVFKTYNQFLFFPYTELALDTQANTTVPFDLDPRAAVDISGNSGEENLVAVAVAIQDAAGGSRLGDTAALNSVDLSTRNTGATAGTHTATTRTLAASPPISSEAENLAFIAPAQEQSIYGTDEGLADTTIFYFGTDNTAGGGIEDATGSATDATGNTDVALLVAAFTTLDVTVADTVSDDAIEATGSQNGVTNSSGQLVSLHDADLVFSTSSTQVVPAEFSDAVGIAIGGTQLRMDRGGRYIVVAYTQNEGSQTGGTTPILTSHAGLKTRAYQTVRFGDTNIAVKDRLSAAPVEIGQTGSSVTINQPGTTPITDALPVNSFAFQDFLGYRCGFQSNANIMWLVWEQSDGTEDRLFCRPVTTTVAAAGTPTLVAGTSPTELEDQVTEAVTGDVTDTTLGSSTRTALTAFNFINGSVNLTRDVHTVDLGQAGSAGVTGGLLLVYRKVTDATSPFFFNSASTGDANGFDEGIFGVGVKPDGTEINRVRLDSTFREDTTDPTLPSAGGGENEPSGGDVGGDLTGNLMATGRDAFAILPVAGSKDITVNDHGVDAVYIYWTEPTQRNNGGTQSDALFTRKWDATAFRTTIPVGPTGTGGATASTGSNTDFAASFQPDPTLEPTRLDRLTGGDVQGIVSETPAANGNRGLVLFLEDGHIWGQTTQDGVHYLTNGNAPIPALVDNDTTSDVVVAPPGPNPLASFCHSGNCDATSGILLFAKTDTNGTRRLRGRTGFTP